MVLAIRSSNFNRFNGQPGQEAVTGELGSGFLLDWPFDVPGNEETGFDINSSNAGNIFIGM
ncbi:hypothetical protein QQZ08_007628 [Neonectria magnoliae]|uniref:Uncharacterized protein n=1 Tax=Neonectria magnoliae TaxID=2732573 RepID=A0ABR1HYN4_9HYPO